MRIYRYESPPPPQVIKLLMLQAVNIGLLRMVSQGTVIKNINHYNIFECCVVCNQSLMYRC